jgi:2-dehydropantoate 2-reductase
MQSSAHETLADDAAPPSFAIIGAGGVGGLLAALLSRAGIPCTLYVRPTDRGAALPAGVRVLRGDEILSAPVRWSSDWSEIAPSDVIVVAVKTWQVAEVCLGLRRSARDTGTVLTLQNGLRAPEIARELLPQADVLAGVCDVRCWREQPGVVRWLGDSVTLLVGDSRARTVAPALAPVAALVRAGVSASVVSDVGAALWSKLVFIAAFGAVGALVRLPIGEIRGNASSRALLHQVAREVAAVAAASGVSLDPALVEDVLRRIDGLPETATSSLQRDIVAGRPSELEDLVSDVVRRARVLCVPVPLCSLIAAALDPVEARARRTAADEPADRPVTRSAAASSASAAASSAGSPALAPQPRGSLGTAPGCD